MARQNAFQILLLNDANMKENTRKQEWKITFLPRIDTNSGFRRKFNNGTFIALQMKVFGNPW